MHPFALSPAGDFLYLGTENGTLRMWSIADHSSPLIEIRAHGSKITNIKLSPDNRSFVTTDDGGIIRLWPILSTAQLRDRFNESPASVEATPATTTKPSIAEFIRRLENWASNRFRQNRQSRPRDIVQPSGRGQMFPSKISRVSYFSRCW